MCSLASSMSRPIPQPPSYPFIGNLLDFDREVPIRGFHELAKQHGEIYKLNLAGRQLVLVNSYRLMKEVSDDTRFAKAVGGALKEVRNIVNDGIFTVTPALHHQVRRKLTCDRHTIMKEAGISHVMPATLSSVVLLRQTSQTDRLLTPPFRTLAIQDMLEDMRDVCQHLIDKWSSVQPGISLDPTDDLTRVALDTLALCSMSYRLNSFETKTAPPFVKAMMDCLKECSDRANRLSLVQSMLWSTNAKFHADILFMRQTAEKIIRERIMSSTDRNDLLGAMLREVDPKTGLTLSEESMVDNLVTFLIAGHETTSGTMSFALYYLLKNPACLKRLRSELDEVLGTEPIQLSDLNKLPYICAVLRETMRLQPTAAVRVVYSLEDTTLAQGQYFISADTPIAIQIWDAQRDPNVWGIDAEEFRPERMLEGKFESLPPNAWQPFGYGKRACIGRAFAWQEMILVLATVLQHFDLSLADPLYELELKQAITIKPKNFYIQAKPRKTC